METNSNHGLDQFSLRVNINASPDVCYKAFATPAGLESWFLRSATFMDHHGNIRGTNESITTDDTYSMLWYGFPDIVSEKGKVTEVNGKNIFCFTFSNRCLVCIRIFTEHNETIVELTETNLPEPFDAKLKHYIADVKGWNFYLTNLKSVLEGGLDLRNRKIELMNVITA